MNRKLTPAQPFGGPIKRFNDGEVENRSDEIELDNQLSLLGEETAQQIDALADACGAQLSRFLEAGDREMATSLIAQRACNLYRTVAIRIGLDDCHYLGAIGKLSERPIVCPQCPQIDFGDGWPPQYPT